jgi:ectoine hydroxylase-related dioxygenase (phytanoyl-CoA dioxygenase family)
MEIDLLTGAFLVIIGVFGMYVIAMQTNWSEDLKNDGYVYIPHLVPDDILQRVLSQSIENLGICTNRQMGDIHHENSKRRDVNLTMTHWVRLLIRHVWTSHQEIWSDVVGENPIFYECSTLMTLPGATPQLWHRDTSSIHAKYKRVLYIGVLLQDTTQDMGALQVIPATHLHNKDIKRDTEKNHVVTCTGNAGDIVCWNANVHHRGGPNVSNKPRFVFYFTVASAEGQWPKGLTSSLRKEYRKHGYPRLCDVIGTC